MEPSKEAISPRVHNKPIPPNILQSLDPLRKIEHLELNEAVAEVCAVRRITLTDTSLHVPMRTHS